MIIDFDPRPEDKMNIIMSIVVFILTIVVFYRIYEMVKYEEELNNRYLKYDSVDSSVVESS